MLLMGLTTGVSYHNNTTVCCAKQVKTQPLANKLQQCFYAVIVAHAYPTLSALLNITQRKKRLLYVHVSNPFPKVKPPPAGGRAAPEQAPFPPLPSSTGNGIEGASQPARPVGPTAKAGQSGSGSGIRRLREDEKRLRDKNVKLQV